MIHITKAIPMDTETDITSRRMDIGTRQMLFIWITITIITEMVQSTIPEAGIEEMLLFRQEEIP